MLRSIIEMKKNKIEKWYVEYEIPPLRAIYRATCPGEGRSRTQVQNLLTHFQPEWKIVKLCKKYAPK